MFETESGARIDVSSFLKAFLRILRAGNLWVRIIYSAGRCHSVPAIELAQHLLINCIAPCRILMYILMIMVPIALHNTMK